MEDTDGVKQKMMALADSSYCYSASFLVLAVSSTSITFRNNEFYPMNYEKFLSELFTLCERFCELAACLSGCGDGSSQRVA